MKNTFTLILLLFFKTSFTQNLVPNSSFEDTIACPFGPTQIFNSTGWSSYKLTPDYFHTCNSGQVGVPSNFTGYQLARTGNAYAGFTTYAKYTVNFREIIGIQLTQPLIIGNTYYLRFYVSRASNIASYNNSGSNKIGARFSTIPFSDINSVSINNFAHVHTDSLISDTSNWTEISNYLVADSNYQFLSIGNFFTDSITTYLNFDSTSSFAYYYCDDITVLDSALTGILEYNSRKIKIFPNPARDWIVLEGKGIKSVEILNALGSAVGSYPTKAFTLRHQINLSSLIRGIYFLKINMIDEPFQFQRLIIQN